jgi:uncharacterized protein (DUF1697 family)
VTMHVAFLRGINVSSHSASKEQLCAAFERLGFEKVATFRASGNVLFDAGSSKPQREPIERELARGLGYDVPVFLRSAKQVASVAAFEPFTREQLLASRGKLQVSFLAKRPPKAARAKALALATADEPLAIEGTELYWLPKGTMRESTLDLKALERLLGAWTMRTKGTVELIAARLTGVRG